MPADRLTVLDFSVDGASLAQIAPYAAIAGAAAALLALLVVAASARGTSRRLERLRIDNEQLMAARHGDAHGLRASLAATERALQASIQAGTSDAMGRAFQAIQSASLAMAQASDRLRGEVTASLREMREHGDAKLAQIQHGVTEQLHAAVEKQMTASFGRVADQFAAVQKAMGDVQAVTAQIGDIKRLFSNVATRGGWGETQVRALLDDMLPPGAYETNWRPRPDSGDVVEFALILPVRGTSAPRLPIDSKFPLADYERLLAAAEAGDAEGERLSRRALSKVIRDEARSIRTKYIVPPVTVDFAVMYLPSDGLYAEIARLPGVIDAIGREDRVIVVGPSLLPALLRTIHLGHVTLAIEQRAEEIHALLGATRTEMLRMDALLGRLHKQAGSFTTTIERARGRSRAVARKLHAVEVMDPPDAGRMLGLAEVADDDAPDGEAFAQTPDTGPPRLDRSGASL